MHLSSFDVVDGQFVNAGEQIGMSGRTGRYKKDGVWMNVKPHLHIELYVKATKDSKYKIENPEKMLSRAGISMVRV
jgi:murein DD-endopeptidase MepM/ murein hydrolase activator NlpD